MLSRAFCSWLAPLFAVIANDGDVIQPRQPPQSRSLDRVAWLAMTARRPAAAGRASRGDRIRQRAAGERARSGQRAVIERQMAVSPHHVDSDGADRRVEVVVALADGRGSGRHRQLASRIGAPNDRWSGRSAATLRRCARARINRLRPIHFGRARRVRPRVVDGGSPKRRR
jgi:hypothetical protein